MQIYYKNDNTITQLYNKIQEIIFTKHDKNVIINFEHKPTFLIILLSIYYNF